MATDSGQQWLRDLTADCLRELARDYENLNAALFSRRLRRPLLSFSEQATEWGAWVSTDRVLRLNLRLLEGPWVELLEVLKHEMAHQYVDEVLRIADEPSHGPTYLQVCRQRGIDFRAHGAPVTPRGAAPPQEKSAPLVLEKVKKLLALAESDNQHEAEAAMAQARRLMLRYNLQSSVDADPDGYRTAFVGAPTARRMAWQRAMANILSEHFFVNVVIVPTYRPLEAKRGTVIELSGTPENLELASYVYDFLERAALDLWKAHKKKHRLKGESQKQGYLYGVMMGFDKKLAVATLKNQGEGLVWTGDPALQAFFRSRHPHIRRVGGRARFSDDAVSAGKEAGSRLVLRPGLKSNQTRNRGRFLPSR